MRLNFYITFNTVKRLIIHCCRLQRGLSLVWNILVIVALRFGKPCNLESTIYCYLTGNTGGGGGEGLMSDSVRSSTHNGIPLQVTGKNYIALLNSTLKFQVQTWQTFSVTNSSTRNIQIGIELWNLIACPDSPIFLHPIQSKTTPHKNSTNHTWEHLPTPSGV